MKLKRLLPTLVSPLDGPLVGVDGDSLLALLGHLVQQPGEVEGLFPDQLGLLLVPENLFLGHHVEFDEQVSDQGALSRVDVAENADVEGFLVSLGGLEAGEFTPGS